jgi:hypothetical protein
VETTPVQLHATLFPSGDPAGQGISSYLTGIAPHRRGRGGLTRQLPRQKTARSTFNGRGRFRSKRSERASACRAGVDDLAPPSAATNRRGTRDNSSRQASDHSVPRLPVPIGLPLLRDCRSSRSNRQSSRQPRKSVLFRAEPATEEGHVRRCVTRLHVGVAVGAAAERCVRCERSSVRQDPADTVAKPRRRQAMDQQISR